METMQLIVIHFIQKIIKLTIFITKCRTQIFNYKIINLNTKTFTVMEERDKPLNRSLRNVKRERFVAGLGREFEI